MPFFDQRYALARRFSIANAGKNILVVTALPPPPVPANVKLTPYTAGTERENVVIAQSNTTVLLPLITPENQGRTYYIKRNGEVDANPVTITPDAADSIESLGVGVSQPLGGVAASTAAILLMAWTDPLTNIGKWRILAEWNGITVP